MATGHKTFFINWVDNHQMNITAKYGSHHFTGYEDKYSAEGVIAPAGEKVTGATIKTWLLNKFISILAVGKLV